MSDINLNNDTNYFEQENKAVRWEFDLDEVLLFTLTHDVQIIRGGDYQYQCFVNKEAYGSSLTPIHALWFGIRAYKLYNNGN